MALEASSINRDIWFATIIGYLGKEGFRRWSILPISKDANAKKDPDLVFQAIADTLEVSTSYWNQIDEMYSDIKQGEDKSIDKLDQRTKNLVEKCPYTEAEKLVCRTELLFHVTKHFEVKKVGSVAETARRCNIHRTAPVCEATQDDGERFQPPQVQWRNGPTDDNRCDRKF